MNTTSTLLEQAKQIDNARSAGRHRPITDDQVEVAIAWAKGEISYNAAQSTLIGRSGMTAYVVLARALREAIQRGILK